MISQRSEQLFESAKPVDAKAQTTDNRGGYDERRNHILEAATGEIARVGYQKASMRAVAKAAGVSLAGLYHYFDGKEGILFLIQFRAFSALLHNVKERLHGVDDPMEQLRVMVRAHVGYFAANMAALKVCSHDLDSLGGSAYEETRVIRREYYEVTRSIVERILDRHAPKRLLDRHVAAMSLFGTLNWLYRWYDPKGGRSPHVLAEQISEQFLRGIVGGIGTDESKCTTQREPPQP